MKQKNNRHNACAMQCACDQYDERNANKLLCAQKNRLVSFQKNLMSYLRWVGSRKAKNNADVIKDGPKVSISKVSYHREL